MTNHLSVPCCSCYIAANLLRYWLTEPGSSILRYASADAFRQLSNGDYKHNAVVKCEIVLTPAHQNSIAELREALGSKAPTNPQLLSVNNVVNLTSILTDVLRVLEYYGNVVRPPRISLRTALWLKELCQRCVYCYVNDTDYHFPRIYQLIAKLLR